MAVDIAAAITAAGTAVIDGVMWSQTMKVSTEVLIPASLSNVWGALVDFPRYRSWHPLVEIEGSAIEGADVEYYYRSNSEAPRGMSMNARITKLEPAREMVMEFGVRGFANIEERYRLVREGSNVRLVHSAHLKGLLPLIGARLFRKRLIEKFQLPIDRLAHHLASKKQTSRSGRQS